MRKQRLGRFSYLSNTSQEVAVFGSRPSLDDPEVKSHMAVLLVMWSRFVWTYFSTSTITHTNLYQIMSHSSHSHVLYKLLSHILLCPTCAIGFWLTGWLVFLIPTFCTFSLILFAWFLLHEMCSTLYLRLYLCLFIYLVVLGLRCGTQTLSCTCRI